MEQLDNTKIPKIGSSGEKYRDIQMVIQLPKQDLAQDYCRHLAGADQCKAFDEFRHVRDATAMDVGCVKEVDDDTVSLRHRVSTVIDVIGMVFPLTLPCVIEAVIVG